MFRPPELFVHPPTNLRWCGRKHPAVLLLTVPAQSLLLLLPQDLSFFFLTAFTFRIFLQFAFFFCDLFAKFLDAFLQL